MSKGTTSTLGNLSALRNLATKATTPPAEAPDAMVAITKIVVVVQIRKKFKNLDELAESIKANGILQPLVVVALPDGTFKLIAGERRLRAAIMLGMKEVPIKVKRGIDEKQARQIQIAENLEREDLTLAEEAAAIIEDVEHYGVDETARLWNRSKGWVSKRNGTRQYRDLARNALETELTGDIELLHALNQLEAVDAKAAGLVVGRLKEGQAVSRDDVRNSVARAKMWAQDQRAAKEGAKPAEDQPGSASHASDSPDANDEAGSARDDYDNGVVQALEPSERDAEGTEAVAQSRKVDARASREAPSQADGSHKAASLTRLRSRIYNDGRSVGGAVGNLPAQLHALGFEQHEGEWVLWTAFLDSVLPALAALGPDRAGPYLKRLGAELKATPPLQLWEQVHVDGHEGADPAPARPEDWRF